MLFNSFEFLLFFPIVTIGYFVLPQKARWLWLLVASCIFYMAYKWEYILILGFTICIDYIAGILIAQSEGQKRKWMLALSLIANIGVLAVFKYWNFGVDSLFGALGNAAAGKNYLLNILLPIGLSFHTFQSMAYTIEVYRGHQPVEKHFGIFALYVMFYPQLVAGPIERPQNLLSQMRDKHAFDYERITRGLKMMAWGFFMKVVIADRISPTVNAVMGGSLAADPTGPLKFAGPTLVIAMILYAFQIYCDFAGYSNIAIGSAEVMGFRLMKNFNHPYFSTGIGDFWSRWHISLSTWFRDYLYIPLGGNRVSPARRILNVFIVFVVSGLWHGASWNFVIWGVLHGAFRVIEMLTDKARRKLVSAIGIARHARVWTLLRVLFTFALATFAWIFFRARTLNEAFYVATHLFSGWGGLLNATTRGQIFDPLGGYGVLAALFALIAVLLFVDLLQERRGSIIEMVNRQPTAVRWAVYYIGIMAIIILGRMATEGNNEFIYFAF